MAPLVWIALALAGVVLVALIGTLGKRQDDAPQSPSQTQASQPSATVPDHTQSQVAGISFPYSIDEGRLEIESLFQYSGINPDADHQNGKDIAAITLRNKTGSYLAEANITMKMADGSQLTFKVTDIPAGKSTMAFSTENVSMKTNDVCVGADGTALYDYVPDISDRVAVRVEGIRITLTNVSDKDIFKIVVSCRCPIDEGYFGGVTYQYIFESLPAGESVTVDALDCILGMVEVVRVEIVE